MSPTSTILIVEDDVGNRELMRYLIGRLHPQAQVIEAATVVEAVSALTTWPISAVITDYHLPDGTGLNVLTVIHEHGLNLPVLANSGDSLVADEMVAAGAIAFIAKPYAMTQMLALLERLIAEDGLVRMVGA